MIKTKSDDNEIKSKSICTLSFDMEDHYSLANAKMCLNSLKSYICISSMLDYIYQRSRNKYDEYPIEIENACSSMLDDFNNLITEYSIDLELIQ